MLILEESNLNDDEDMNRVNRIIGVSPYETFNRTFVFSLWMDVLCLYRKRKVVVPKSIKSFKG